MKTARLRFPENHAVPCKAFGLIAGPQPHGQAANVDAGYPAHGKVSSHTFDTEFIQGH